MSFLLALDCQGNWGLFSRCTWIGSHGPDLPRPSTTCNLFCSAFQPRFALGDRSALSSSECAASRDVGGPCSGAQALGSHAVLSLVSQSQSPLRCRDISGCCYVGLRYVISKINALLRDKNVQQLNWGGPRGLAACAVGASSVPRQLDRYKRF